jgi:hypothetical protein
MLWLISGLVGTATFAVIAVDFPDADPIPASLIAVTRNK